MLYNLLETDGILELAITDDLKNTRVNNKEKLKDKMKSVIR